MGCQSVASISNLIGLPYLTWDLLAVSHGGEGITGMKLDAFYIMVVSDVTTIT